MDYWQLGFGLLFLIPALVGFWGIVFRPHVYSSSFMVGFVALMLLLFGAYGVTLIVTSIRTP